jgi:DNA polymerase I-like protein with 3'-5' exonuclease and polymerase domains
MRSTVQTTLNVESDWRPSTEYPDLRAAKLLAVDAETHDPDLQENGPGAVRGVGQLVGFSLATEDGWRGYFPLAHQGGDNVENPKACLRWLKKQLSRKRQPKVGANIIYDREWLRVNGIEMAGKTYDVQVAEGLLDENKLTYNLDSLAQEYLSQGKDETLLMSAGKELLGISGRADTIGKQVKSNLWRLPARYVGPYGEADADRPIRIHKLQEVKLKDESLWELYQTEVELIDLLLDMRFRGIPVDVDKAEEVADELARRQAKATRHLNRLCGFSPNVWANEDLERMCKTLGYHYMKTPKGNPSFPADWLEQQDHKALKLVVKVRRLDRAGSVYVRSKILDLQVNGRVYPQFWQVKTDAQGARHGTSSGRFASSNPNAQQIPARDPEIAPLVRRIFVAEQGAEWCKNDWSQQEPRLTVHYAYKLGCRGAEEARDRYVNDPATDYHVMVAELCDIERKPAKTINLALSYGMGVKTMARRLGIHVSDAQKLLDEYHAGVPFIRELSRRCQRVVRNRGYLKTLLGRRRRFDLWGPPKWSDGVRPLKYEEAIKKFGRPVQLYFLHKTLNALIQGSAADMVKVAMLQLKHLGHVPHITVHDELDHSVTSSKEIKEIREVMLTCVKLEVPVKVDTDIGPSWGNLKEWTE